VPNVTPAELDAILISQLLTSADRVLIGANLPAPRAGALLAALTHAPGLRVCQGLGWMDPRDQAEPRPPHPGMDVRDADGSEALLLDHEAYDDVRRLSTLFVIGGFEIDATGATNLLGERRHGRWVRRGAGAIGTTSMAILAGRTILYTTRHDQRVFVERCAVVSAPGWNGERGPTRCFSPAGVFDFEGPGHRMRLVHTRPGWTPEAVQQATGFALAGLDSATRLPDPDAEVVAVLRGRVDAEGLLQ
jgi:glutaconate CoA-transferase subunit B